MSKKRVIFFLAAVVLIFAFCWGLFFTYGLPFFWEDFDYFQLYQNQDRSQLNLPNIVNNISREFIAPRQFFQAGFSCSFNDRPYQYITNSLLTYLFIDKITFFRLFRALILSFYAALLFIIISDASILWGFLAVFVYLTSGEVWSALAVTCDTGLGSQLAVLLAVAIFIRLLKKREARLISLWIPYVLIFILSQYAILSKCDGRYLSAVFFLTLLFFNRGQLVNHLPMLSVLFITEVPVMGYLMKFFSKTPFYPINIASHNASSIVQSLTLITKNYIYPLMAIGRLSLILLCLALLIHAFYLFSNRNKKPVLRNKDGSILRERAFLFFLLFMVNLSMIAISRSFAYEGPYNIGLSDCVFFIPPFLLFLSYYSVIIADYLKKSHKRLFIILCILLMLGESVFFRLPRLNRFRGGWGNYFCAWSNTEKYINNISHKALVLSINKMHYLPFSFHNSTNQIEHDFPPAEKSLFSDMGYIEKRFKEGDYVDLFVIYDNPVNFRGRSQYLKLENTTVIDGDSNDLFDRLKRLIDIRSRPLVFVYHFKADNFKK